MKQIMTVTHRALPLRSVGTQLPNKLHDRLKCEARSRGRSIGHIIAESLCFHLGLNPVEYGVKVYLPDSPNPQDAREAAAQN